MRKSLVAHRIEQAPSTIPPTLLPLKSSSPQSLEELVYTTLLLFAGQASADGFIHETELLAIKKIVRRLYFIDVQAVERLSDIVLRNIQEVSHPLIAQQGASALRPILTNRQKLRIITSLFQIAENDGELKPVEYEYFETVGAWLGIDPEIQKTVWIQ